jgi:hypothetical protein
MTAGPALPCPKCKRPLQEISWHDAGSGRCERCRTDFSFIGFPALTAEPARIVPQAVLVSDHSTCFYHSENQAELVCESCGRFLCAVCAIEFVGRRVCPNCVARSKEQDVQAIEQRTLYGGIALGTALLPVLSIVFWPFTLFTAPTALGFVIFGWRRPRSLVNEGRTKLVIAGVLALLEIGGWVTVGLFAWLKKK